MTTGETVKAAVFLLELGGTWTTDCRCIAVFDKRWTSANAPNWSTFGYRVAYTYTDGDIQISGVSAVIHESDPTQAILLALAHECSERAYIPVEVVPV